jgi:hypothetical protein
MCPDQQLLSIYLDGELPSPWKEKIQAHFAQCPICKEKLENFKKLQELFKKDKSICRTYVERTADKSAESGIYTEQELIEAKERVWGNIESRRKCPPRFGLLRQRLSIPLPAAAAAAAIILLLAAFLLVRGNQPVDTAENTNFILAAEMDRIDEFPVMIPAADMSGVLQYLAPEGTNIIIFQLPENKNFLRSGEPAIIKAADFTQNVGTPRGRPSRDDHSRRQPQ